MATTYYFCTAVWNPDQKGDSMPVIDSRYPTVNDVLEKCCAEMSGTIGASTAGGQELGGDRTMSQGIMGCGFAAIVDPLQLKPNTTWAMCALTQTSINFCMSSGAGSLVAAQPLPSGSGVGTSSMSMATSAAAGITSTAAGTSSTAADSKASGSPPSGLGIGGLAFLVVSLALAIVRIV